MNNIYIRYINGVTREYFVDQKFSDNAIYFIDLIIFPDEPISKQESFFNPQIISLLNTSSKNLDCVYYVDLEVLRKIMPTKNIDLLLPKFVKFLNKPNIILTKATEVTPQWFAYTDFYNKLHIFPYTEPGILDMYVGASFVDAVLRPIKASNKEQAELKFKEILSENKDGYIIRGTGYKSIKSK